MANNEQKLKATVTADISQYESSLKRASQIANQEAGKMQGAFAGAGGFLSSALSVAAGNLASAGISKLVSSVTDIVSIGLDFNDTIEKSTIAFTTFTGSAEQAQKQIETLKKEALTNPFEFTDLLRASQNLTAMGFKAEETVPLIRILTDQVSALGGSAADLQGLAEVFGKIRSEGALAGMEMRQLAIRGIPAYEMLAKVAGKSVQEIKKLSEAGQINPDSAVTIILAEMQKKTGGLSEKLAGTLTGKLSNMHDALAQTAGKLTSGPDGLYQGYKDTIDVGLNALGSEGGDKATQAIAGYINKVGKAALLPIRDLAKGDFAQAGVDLMNGLMDGMKSVFDTLSGPVIQMGKDIIQGLNDGMEVMGQIIKNTAFDMASSIYQTISKFMDSHSPSKKMFDLGVNIIGGLTMAFVQDKSSEKAAEEFSRNLYQALAKMPKGGWMNNGGDPFPFIADIVQSSLKHNLDPKLLAGIFAQETGGFRPSVIYGGENNKAARGIGQFIPSTGRQYGLTINDKIDERTDPKKSIEAAAKYVKFLNDLFGGDTDLVLAAYNAGQGAVQKYGNKIPPYAETKKYVEQIDKLLQFMGGVANPEGGQSEWQKATTQDFTFETGTNPFKRPGASASPFNASNRPGVTPVYVTNAAEISSGGGGSSAKKATLDDLTPEQQSNAFHSAVNQSGIGAIPGQLDIFFGALPTKLSHLSDTEIAEVKKVSDAIQQEEDKAAKNMFRQTPEQLARLRITFKQVGDVFESTFGQALGNLDQGFKQFFSEMVLGFLKSIEQMAAAAVAGNLRNLLFGPPTAGATAESGGGLLGKILGIGIGIVGGLVGGKIGGGLGPIGPGAAGGSYGGFKAEGGDVKAGVQYMTGERGRELFVPKSDGNIINNDTLNKMGGGRSVTVVNHFHITSPDGKIAPESQRQAAERMMAALQRVA
jgi:tape measure domain-containing protein